LDIQQSLPDKLLGERKCLWWFRWWHNADANLNTDAWHNANFNTHTWYNTNTDAWHNANLNTHTWYNANTNVHTNANAEQCSVCGECGRVGDR
jgi:hypothetical protein